MKQLWKSFKVMCHQWPFFETFCRLETIAQAERNKVILEAEAAAEAIRVQAEAEAFAIEAKAKAEAEGIVKKADAWKYQKAAIISMVFATLAKVAAEISRTYIQFQKDRHSYMWKRRRRDRQADRGSAKRGRKASRSRRKSNRSQHLESYEGPPLIHLTRFKLLMVVCLVIWVQY